MKDLIIIRGLPGSGKTVFAKLIGRAICCADEYLVNRDGKYEWHGSKLQAAHNWCIRKCEKFIKRNISPVIIANTSHKERDLRPYYDLAKKYGYRVFSIIVENRHNGKNFHGVSDESLKKYEENFNIKLI